MVEKLKLKYLMELKMKTIRLKGKGMPYMRGSGKWRPLCPSKY